MVIKLKTLRSTQFVNEKIHMDVRETSYIYNKVGMANKQINDALFCNKILGGEV